MSENGQMFAGRQVDAASQGGMISFRVQLDEADNPNLLYVPPRLRLLAAHG